jgi:hypothetical protein
LWLNFSSAESTLNLNHDHDHDHTINVASTATTATTSTTTATPTTTAAIDGNLRVSTPGVFFPNFLSLLIFCFSYDDYYGSTTTMTATMTATTTTTATAASTATTATVATAAAAGCRDATRLRVESLVCFFLSFFFLLH